jgi:CheY-like chemotaxis protein
MVDSVVKIVEVLAKLLGIVAWPSVALIFLWWFGSSLRDLFANISDWSLKAFGVDFSAKRISREAIITAEVTKLEGDEGHSDAWKDGVSKTLRDTEWINQLSLKDFAGKIVLWVDDRPENNIFEKDALEALGIRVEFVPNTLAAIRRIKGREYNVIISDMARPEGEKAGYELLEKLQQLRPDTPFILYSSSNTPDQERAIKSAGAFGSTARASELVRLVTDAIRSSEKRLYSSTNVESSIRRWVNRK